MISNNINVKLTFQLIIPAVRVRGFIYKHIAPAFSQYKFLAVKLCPVQHYLQFMETRCFFVQGCLFFYACVLRIRCVGLSVTLVFAFRGDLGCIVSQFRPCEGLGTILALSMINNSRESRVWSPGSPCHISAITLDTVLPKDSMM